MARHLWQKDCERRAAIRAAKDQAPASTIKDLQHRFGVSGNIIGVALEKTTTEWQAMAAMTPARITYRPRKAMPLGITVVPKGIHREGLGAGAKKGAQRDNERHRLEPRF